MATETDIEKSNADSGFQNDQNEINIKSEIKIKRKRKKKKKSKKHANFYTDDDEITEDNFKNDEEKEDIILEYIPELPDIDPLDPNYRHFVKVFNNFKITAEAVNNPKGYISKLNQPRDEKVDSKKMLQIKEAPVFEEKDDEEDLHKKKNYPSIDEEGEEKPQKLSKKKWKKMNRLTVAELKQLVKRPDVVEMYDVTAPDPHLLITLKSVRNTVPVPRHWCFKRKYLAGKRGFEKAPFDLPDFIKKTGIMEMRQAVQDKEEHSSLKAKMKQRIRPRMGKIDIDYQKLHDAFFRWQTKPKMTTHGDLYYEGKELEIKMKEKKPGDFSDELREALGMPTGMGCEKTPPPWLIAQQRYGPPPSYPDQKIPGLNAPIPEGCTFGYHMGGWGKPPVDEFGNPLYGDVFNTRQMSYKGPPIDEEVDKTPWGELESESEDEIESSEDEAPPAQQEVSLERQTGLITPAEPGLITPSGLSSTPGGIISGLPSLPPTGGTASSGLVTPEIIELRKKKKAIESEMESGSEVPALYKVIPQKMPGQGASIPGGANQFLATHVYDISAAKDPNLSGILSSMAFQTPNPLKTGTVEIALAPEEIDLVDAKGALAHRYEQQIKAARQAYASGVASSSGIITGTLTGNAPSSSGILSGLTSGKMTENTNSTDLSDMVAEHSAKQNIKRKKQQEEKEGKTTKKYKEFKF